MLSSHIRYLRRRKSVFRIHSPFVYDLAVNVLDDKRQNTDYDLIVRLSRLLDGKQHGMRFRREQSRILYRLMNHFKPGSVITFGNISALNASALALGNLRAKVYLQRAADFIETMNSVGVVNVEQLPQSAFHSDNMKRIEANCVFFAKDAFSESHWNSLSDCMLHKYSNSFFIFEGIHESEDIEDAWEKFIQDEEVTVSVDLYRLGLVFFRIGTEKQNFVLKC